MQIHWDTAKLIRQMSTKSGWITASIQPFQVGDDSANAQTFSFAAFVFLLKFSLDRTITLKLLHWKFGAHAI